MAGGGTRKRRFGCEKGSSSKRSRGSSFTRPGNERAGQVTAAAASPASAVGEAGMRVPSPCFSLSDGTGWALVRLGGRGRTGGHSWRASWLRLALPVVSPAAVPCPRRPPSLGGSAAGEQHVPGSLVLLQETKNIDPTGVTATLTMQVK